MNQVPPPPPQHMPGRQGVMPGPPRQQQFPQQQQQFPPQQFQQQPQQFQQARPIINDNRFIPDQPINRVARIHSIVPIKQKTEKDYRKELTTYAAYTISPSVDEDKKDKKDKDKRSSSSSWTKDKKSSDKNKGTWTRALIIEQFFSQDEIAATIKRLEGKESVTKKMKELGPNQNTQISNILDDKLISDRDIQFEWVVAQLDRSFNVDKQGKKSTKSITVYLKRAPKADVDCFEILRRRDAQKIQQAQNAEHQRNMHQMQQQHQMQMQAQAQQQQAQQQFRPPMGPGPRGQIGPPMNGGGRGGNRPAGIQVVRSESGSDSSSSSSGSDSDSDSESDANSDTTPESVSTRPSRSSRRRRDKQYYGRGTSRNRSRSRQRNKDYLVIEPPRRRDPRTLGVHYVPDSPRGSSRPPLGRGITYNGRPSVVVQHGRQQSPGQFFSMNPHSPRVQPHPILHQTRPEVASSAHSIDGFITTAVQAGVQAGLRAGREENVTAGVGALTVQRPPATYRDLALPRPPMPHSISDYLDRRTQRELDEAEAVQRHDELARYPGASRMRGSRSPLRGLPRDLERTVPRRFAAAEHYDPYSSAPMSPSISSGSSGVSYSSRGGRDPFAPRDQQYDYRRGEGSRLDSDREEYDFIGREEANPFRPLHTGRRTPSRPPPLRRGSFRSEAPYPRDRY